MDPLNRRIILDTRSLDAARSSSLLFNDTVTMEATGSEQNFHLRIGSVNFGAGRISVVSTTGHRISVRDNDFATLLIPIRGVISVNDKREEISSDGGLICVPRPGERLTSTSQHYVGFVVQIPLADLLRDTSPSLHAKWRFAGKLQTSSGFGATIVRLVEYISRECNEKRSALLRSPTAMRGAFSVIQSLFMDGLADKQLSFASLSQLRRAEEYAKAHLSERLRIADLARSAGVSTRTLQQTFWRKNGYGPWHFIENARLEAVQARLQQPLPNDSVTSVILSNGVSHASRFAAQYKRKFGELPVETLRRARQLARKIQQGLCAAESGVFSCTAWLRGHADSPPALRLAPGC